MMKILNLHIIYQFALVCYVNPMIHIYIDDRKVAYTDIKLNLIKNKHNFPFESNQQYHAWYVYTL